MAYIQKSGSRYTVRQGNTGKVLHTVSSRSRAQSIVTALHREHNPSARNRGATAARRNRRSR